LSRLFISHSSADSVAAIAFKQWLGANGWPSDEVFLDVEDIGGGERWKEALRRAHARCEAVILLASPDALASPECLAEVRNAEDFGKEIVVVLLRDLTVADRRLDSYKERQIVDLSALPVAHVEAVDFRDVRTDVHFNDDALAKIKDYLIRRGINPDSFPWPPAGKPDAEPFPGLSAFGEDDAAIFFGRDADILTSLDEFRLLRRKGSPRFLAIQAASGAGKSSFMRAGLWPRLARDPDFATLAILRPAQGILTGPEGLGQKLARQLSRPGATINPGDIYTRLMADDVTRAAEEFARLMALAAEQACDERKIGNPDAPPPALVLAIDQAEELLAPENASESGRFLTLLAGLMRAPPKDVEAFGILTVRADGAAPLYQAIADLHLEVPRPLTLLPLPSTSYRDVIVRPIGVVARQRKITISAALADRLVADATGADALPLLAFTLFQLYKGFGAGGSLTLDQYDAIGGVGGSIKQAIKEALDRPGDAPSIPAGTEQQLACLRETFIPALARIDTTTGEPARRVAQLDQFEGSSRAMVDRLVEKRLLVRDQRSGQVVVEVAHESLFRQWAPLANWLHSAADDLRIVDAVERAAGEWVRNAKLPPWLDHRADRLSAAERVASRPDFSKRFGRDERDYLVACRAREVRQRRILQTLAACAAAVVVVIGVLLVRQWQETLLARQAQRESAASLLIAHSDLDLNDGNVAAAIDRAQRAFKSVPSAATRSALFQAFMEVSPHLAAAIPLGNGSPQALGWTTGERVDIVASSGSLREFDLSKPAESSAAWNLSSVTRPTDGNKAKVMALATLSDERLLAVFDEGSIGIYRRRTAVRLLPPANEISVNQIQHAVAVGPSGSLIAAASVDGTILLYRCKWDAPPSESPCASDFLGQARGQVVAISPDEKWIAVGDQAGKVTIYDPAGNVHGTPASFNASISALGWATQGNWLAVGTATGAVVVVDVGSDAPSFARIEQQVFGDKRITALAWSPREPTLAFVCNETTVCVWRSNAAVDNPFAPAMRLEGHRNTISRLSFAPDGASLASAAADGMSRVWSLSPDSGASLSLPSAAADGSARVRSLAQDRDAGFELYADEDTAIVAVAVSPDQKWVAGGGADGTIELWDARAGTARRAAGPSEGSLIGGLSWSSTGAVAAIDDNNTVNVVYADAGKPPVSIRIERAVRNHVAWAEDRLVAVPSDSGIILLDPAAPAADPVSVGTGGTEEAWGITAVPQSATLLVSYISGKIAIWDLASKKIVGSMSNPGTKPQGAESLSVRVGAILLAVSSGDSNVTLYDIGKRGIWRVLETESPEISAVAFSPDGSRLAVLGNDNRLYVWTLGENSVDLYLSVSIVPRRGIVGNTANRGAHASWLDWVTNEQIAVATGIAAVSVYSIDPNKWLKRIDDLAAAAKVPKN
jgi:WD40 repeat protein